MTTQLRIADIPVGPGHPPLFLPDIGTFFDRDTERAEALIRAIHAAGARVLKAEILHDAEICLDDDTVERYFDPDKGMQTERYRELIERKCVPLEQYARLLGIARDLGMPVVLSVYDDAGVEFALEQGVAALKVASTNIVHAALIRRIAATGLPMIIDTGKADAAEIARAVAWARVAGAEQLIVEHSPVPPPASLDDHDLRMIPELAQRFDCLSGLSDHHAGAEMLVAATALGASVLEKGVCPDDQSPDQDVAHALRVSELGEVLRQCLNVHQALGRSMRE